MARFRLRFLLQEFDLPPGETLLGRSPECHVTIEDPLVSRRHAKIIIRGDKAIVQDLGSRNGVRINGQPAPGGQAYLKDGDRLRVGTQELVFCAVASVPEDRSKQTGFLRHCAKCKTPYPEEMAGCPNCGANEFADDETLTGAIGAVKRNWTLQLLTEVLEKAVSLGKEDEAERILKRASSHIEELVQNNQYLDPRQIDALAECASKLSEQRQTSQWGLWVLQTYSLVGEAPPITVLEQLGALPAIERSKLSPAFNALLNQIQTKPSPTPKDADAVARLHVFQRELGA